MIFLINTSYAHMLSGLFSRGLSVQELKLIQQETQKKLCLRLLVGFVGGFCINVFGFNTLVSNGAGIPATASAGYVLNKYVPIIQNNRQALDVAGGYVAGVIAGILVRKAAQQVVKKFNAVFNKPEARVVVTKRT